MVKVLIIIGFFSLISESPLVWSQIIKENKPKSFTRESVSTPIKVNGTEVSIEHIDSMYSFQLSRLGLRIDSVQKSYALYVKQNIALQLIDELLIEQESKKEKMTISPQDLNMAYQGFMKAFPNSQEKEKYISSIYGNETGIKKQLKTKLLLEKLANINKNGIISLEEAKNYYDRHSMQYNSPGHFFVSELVFPIKDSPNEEYIEGKKLKATEFLQNARQAGVSYSLLAKKYKRENEGIKFLQRQVYKYSTSQLIWNTLSVLRANEISDAIELEDGFHVYKLIYYFPERTIAFDNVKDDIINKIRNQRFVEQIQETLTCLRKKANIENSNFLFNKEVQRFLQISSEACGQPGLPAEINIEQKGSSKSISIQKFY
jgi:hypothetical protein